MKAQLLGGAHRSLGGAQKLLERAQMLLGVPIERASKEARRASRKQINLSGLLRYERELGGLRGCTNNHPPYELNFKLSKLKSWVCALIEALFHADLMQSL